VKEGEPERKIGQVVMPLPGYDSLYPTNAVGEVRMMMKVVVVGGRRSGGGGGGGYHDGSGRSSSGGSGSGGGGGEATNVFHPWAHTAPFPPPLPSLSTSSNSSTIGCYQMIISLSPPSMPQGQRVIITSKAPIAL